ncbi:GatB/YqeY domain-containing protein [Psychrobacter sp. WY6]|uniref:GatB/YqeY domain-containing protein n=1 Tax=Psychrobacter sp. WY6 TaxID=2708350 RepID=UPI002022E65C|nr:GatB/YqeY domain-containing protein [Psychrobacter sp. WY6]
MSQLKQTLSDNVKVSMKARELERVKVLRNVQAVIKQIEIDRQIELDDAQVLDILQKQLKQRHESLTIFTENNRDDLATKEHLIEIDIINEFMPKQMDDAELAALVNAEIAAQGATSMRDMGSVMGVLKNKTAGRADPALISKLVKDALQGQ